jgi:membrane protein implicated in regulation of membrane protease activity
MSALPWFWIWLVLAAALYIGEMISLTFFLLPFGIGASVAFLSVLFGAEVWLQWVLFVVVSIVALIALRPAYKHLVHKADKAKVGVDRLIGMTGKIIEGNAPSGEMRARVAREVWNVSTDGDDTYAVDTRVKVLRVEGVHLIVEKVEETAEAEDRPAAQETPGEQLA